MLYRICMICIWIDWKFSSEFNCVHLEVIWGQLGGQKGHFWVENRKYCQMHMIYIPFDWKFASEFNGVHLEVSRGHQSGQTRSFWGHKSETRPTTHNTHMIRFKILFWFQWREYHGHSRSSKRSKKVILRSERIILNSKISTMTIYTIYAYWRIDS